MRRTWKSGLSMLLAASMVLGSAPVGVQAVAKSAVVGVVEKDTTANKTTKKVKKGTLAKTNDEEKYVEGQAVILYDKSNSKTAKAATASIGGDIEIVHTYDFDSADTGAKTNSTAVDGGISVSLVKSETYSTEELVALLSKNSDIKCAQPNYKIKTTAVGNDTYKDFQWALDNKGQNGGTEGLDINADALYDVELDGEERVIALVDTGVDYTHEDLADVIWTNPFQSKKFKGEHGYDFFNYDEDPMDDNGHGSHCAGIMAASVGNDAGIAGVTNNENIKIMALKAFSEYGEAYGYEMIGAYNYIYKAQQLGVNVVAINNSWGSSYEDYILEVLINLVGENGAISVCAAGNDALDNDEYGSWPANSESPYVISVAASTENDELAPFSNYGIESVDIAAPGTAILSSVSYNNYNPSLYENPDEISSVMHDFSEGNLVKTIDDDGFIEAEIADGDIEYGIATLGGEAEMSLELSDDSYFGVNDGNNKSLEWTLKGAKAGEIYHLYFPYTATKTGYVNSSVAVKGNGPAGEMIYDPMWDEYYTTSSVLFVADGPLDSEGVYDEYEEFLTYGGEVTEVDYWGHGAGMAEVKKGEKRAIAVQLYVGVDGDYTVNMDDFGIAKDDVDEEMFGKYAFYNGTSMATPHVTGAVAAVASAYADESAMEIKARVLGSTRKSDALEGKIGTAGVLDLSKVDSPNMSVESIYRDEGGMVYINGYFLDDAIVLVDGEEVELLEASSDCITIDGSEYTNRNVEITVVKDDYSLTYNKFFAEGESFEYGLSFGGLLDGGNVVSSGDTMYYVDQYGAVYMGTPAEKEGMKTLEWEELYGYYSPDMFGEEYSYIMDYIMTNETEAIYASGTLWSIVTLDVGYSEETALLTYDAENMSWIIADYLPKEMEEVEGYSIAAYNGDVYLFGGYDNAEHTYSTKVFKYNAEDMIWEDVADMPEGRVYAKALQVGDKLVVTLGGNEDNEACKNMIFDGETWYVSETDMGTVYNTIGYVLDEGTEYETSVDVATAQIGIVEDGIVYTDIFVESLGDTFVYSVSEDAYESTGYMLDRESLYCDQLYATTVQDDLYVIYGYDYFEDDYEDWMAENKEALNDDYYEDGEVEDEEYWDTYIELLTMPVESGFGQIVDESEEGVYIVGPKYFVAGDTVTIKADSEADYFVKGMTVNGEKVRKKEGVYTYTLKDATNEDIVAAAQAGAYVTAINIPDTITIKQGETAQLTAEVLPENADNKNIIWYSMTDDVTVDSTGMITVTANAVPGEEYIIYASSQDREYPMAQCVVVVEEAEETTKEQPTTTPEETTTSVEETTTGKEEATTVTTENTPVVGSKVTVGKNVYRVVTNTEDNRSVSFVGLKNKKATKATVPATVKIDGETFKVTAVASNAFKKCKKLKKVTIGKNVTSIGKNAFNGCKKLKTITIKSKNVTTIKKKAFKNANKKLVIKVPKKSKKTYKKMLKKAGFKGTVK